MTVINKKYEYKYSMALIKAMAGNLTHNLRLILHDYEFPTLKRGTIFKNRALNLFQADSYLRKQNKSAINNVVNSIHTYALHAPATVTIAIIKPYDYKRDCTRLSAIEHRGRNPFVPDYYSLYNLIKALKPVINEWHGLPLVHAIESTQHGKALYVHGHMMIASNQPGLFSLLETVMDSIARQYGYHVELEELADVHGQGVTISANTSYKSLGMNAIRAFTSYCYKQYKMPVPYGNNNKARTAYQRFIALSPSAQREVIMAIVNSTHRMQLRGHISFKRYAKTLTVHGLAQVTFNLHKYQVTAPQPLFSMDTVHTITPTHSTYHSYLKQWRLAMYLARRYDRAVHQGKASGQSNGLAGQIASLNALYIALNNAHQADCISNRAISACNELEKNNRLDYKADYANGDRLRATGTPP